MKWVYELLLIGILGIILITGVFFQFTFFYIIIIRPIKLLLNKVLKVIKRKKIKYQCNELDTIRYRNRQTHSYIEDLKKSIQESPWGLYVTKNKWNKSKYCNPMVWDEISYTSIEDVKNRRVHGKVNIMAVVGYVSTVHMDGISYHELTVEDPSGKLKVEVGLLDAVTEYKLSRRGHYFNITLEVDGVNIIPTSFESI